MGEIGFYVARIMVQEQHEVIVIDVDFEALEQVCEKLDSTVTDTGLGIPPDLQDKIFDPNFSTKTSGTGLGLAIARKSIEEFHGAIGFETDEGSGTTFWIRLLLVE